MNIQRELEVCAAVSPAPWTRWKGHADVYAGQLSQNNRHCIGGKKGGEFLEICRCEDDAFGDVKPKQARANAEFIAAAREGYPTALKMLQEIQALCQQRSHAGCNPETHALASKILGIMDA